MRIVVNDFAASSGGGATILRSLYDYIIQSNDENEWIFLLSDYYLKETEKIKVLILEKEKKSRIRRLAFDLWYGKQVINKLNPDVVFYLQNTLVHGVKCPQIMYMDQSIAFQNEKKFSFFKKEERTYAVYQYFIGYFNRVACKKANRVIVQTKWLQDAIVAKTGKNVELVDRVAPSVLIDKKKYRADAIDTHNFFYPASDALYKNHDCIYKAMELIERTDYKVVLTTVGNGKESKNCECIGSITQQEVYERMCKSVLVFPSYIESYGLPLKEAREIGTIILAANTAFAQEILEDYDNAYFFDTFNPNSLAVLMGKVLDGTIQLKQQSHNEKEVEQEGWAKVCRLLREACNE